jgi:hypothetical protein
LNCVVLLQWRNLLGTSQITFTFWEKIPKGSEGVSSVPSFEKLTLDFRSQTSNFQSFEKKKGLDFCVFFSSNSLSLRGGEQGVYRITLTALTLNNL